MRQIAMDGASPFYMRPSLGVETYDARSTVEMPDHLQGDVEFFMKQARRVGGRVLELGSGTGRVAWPLAAAGFDVVGIDLSPAMIDVARAKADRFPATIQERARFLEGSMAEFDLGERFGLVFSAFRAFQSLLEPEEQRSCLACARRHLRPGGVLVLDLFDPRLEYLVPDGVAPRERPSVPHPVTGNETRIRVTDRRVDLLRQQFTEEWLFEEVGGDGVVVRQERGYLSLRWTYRQEMRYLLELSGFEIEAEYSDFKGSPPRYGAEQVWVAHPVV